MSGMHWPGKPLVDAQAVINRLPWQMYSFRGTWRDWASVFGPIAAKWIARIHPGWIEEDYPSFTDPLGPVVKLGGVCRTR